MKITAQPSTASACERNWSTYSFIHSKRRNKLAPERAADLVYVFSNARVVRSSGMPEQAIPWTAPSEDGSDSDNGEDSELGDSIQGDEAVEVSEDSDDGEDSSESEDGYESGSRDSP